MSITPKKKRIKKTDYRFGEVLTKYYDDLRDGRVTEDYIPRSDLAYITSLLNNKFNKNYSFQEVNRLLKECLGAAIDG